MDRCTPLNLCPTGGIHLRGVGKDRLVHSLRGNGGFTIVEVIVAIIIFITALLGLMSVTTGVIQGDAISMQMTTATSLAQDGIEDLKRKGFEHADLAAGNHNDPGNPLSILFTRTWNVSDNTPDAGIKTLTVAVNWNWRGTARNVQLVTFITSK